MRELKPEDLYELRFPSDPRLSPDGARVAYVQTTPDRDNDSDHSTIWVCTTKGGETDCFTQGPGDASPRWSPDGEWLGFLRKEEEEGKPQVWVISVNGGEARQVTQAPQGVTEFAWSPNGRRIAFTSPVSRDGKPEDEERARILPIEISELPLKQPIGEPIDRGLRPHLFVAEIHDDQTSQLTHGDFSVLAPAWSPDGSEIAFVSAMHPQRGLDGATHVFVVGTERQQVRRVTAGPGTAATPVWAPKGDRIVFVGQAEASFDALNHLFAVDAGGGEATDLIADFDRNVMVGAPGYPGAAPQLARDGTAIIFCARDGGCVHIFEVALDGGSPSKVIGGGDRVVVGMAAGPAVAFVASDLHMPGDVFVAELDGSTEHQLTRLNDEALTDIELVPHQRRRFKAPDGTPVEAWLIDGGGDQPRPLLLDIHGGPHNAWGPGFPSQNLHSQLLAADGWAILLLNSRGSDGYGQEFMRALRGGWGVNDLNDFMAAVDALVAEGVADPDRLAVTGYSYGGYMTNWIVTQTDRFAAAVSGGSVSNLTSFYGTADIGALVMSLEMETEPHEKPDLLRDLSPVAHASSVNTPMLILHGEADNRCPIGQAEEWFVALKRQGKPVQLVVYPRASHIFVFQGRPSHRVDYARRVVDWVTAHVESSSTRGRRWRDQEVVTVGSDS